jgi:pimeloyl-ACP methyl ester carboxylesterase
MEPLRYGASLLLNSICFRPLPKSRYGFDFKHAERKVVYIPVQVDTPSPAPEKTTTNGKSTPVTYHIPCMLIQGKSLSKAFASANNNHKTATAASTTSSTTTAKNIILHFHGTSGDIEKSHLWADLGKDLPDYDILCVEFPGGYGTASSRFPSSSTEFEPFFCSRESLMTVARAVTDFVIQKCGFPEQNIVFSGRSMGTGVAIELGARYYPNCANVILLSPYASMSAVVRGVVERKLGKIYLGWLGSFLIKHLLEFLCSFGRTSLFESQAYAERINCPVWIAHGKKDNLIPIQHAEILQSLIRLNTGSRRSSSSPSSRSSSPNNTITTRSSGNDSSKRVYLHVDPEGDHPNVAFQKELAQHLTQLAPSLPNYNPAETKTISSWDEAPFADQATIQKLQENFARDNELAANFAVKCKRAFIVSAIVVFALSVAGSVLAWKNFVKPKILGW